MSTPLPARAVGATIRERALAYAADLQARLARAQTELATCERRLADALAAKRRSEARARRAQQECDRLHGQVRYRLGDALVSALRPGRDTLLLPLRLAALVRQGIARQRARRKARTQAVPVPARSAPSSVRRVRDPAAKPVGDPDAARRGVLFFCVNGAGLGHLTRSLAVARRLKRLAPAVPLRFLTSSRAVDVIEREGIPAQFIPPARTAARCIPAREWNGMLFETLERIGREYRPRVLVYDGVFPYAGLMKAIDRGGFEHATMILRLRHKHATLREKADLLWSFHELVFPGEAAAGEPGNALPPELRVLPHRFVDPIILLDQEELLDREAARAELELDPGRRAVFVQLGAGNINSTCAWIDCILDTLATRTDVQVVLAESPITDTPHPERPGVRVLRQYPNARYFRAFDLAVTAAGYNTFHELMHFGVPSILIPNQETRTDDQVQRALTARRAHAGLAVLRPEELPRALELALRDDVARMFRERARALVPANGARAVAEWLRRVVGAPSAFASAAR